MNHPNVSVIIPCRNEERYISQCVDSIIKQVYGGKVEVIIVDGVSDDNTLSIIGELTEGNSNIKLVTNIEKTTPQAMNLGLKAASYDLILRIDAHAIALPNFIQNNVETLFESDEVMCAGGKIINIYENKISYSIGMAMSSIFGVGNATFRVGGEKKFVDTLAFGIYRKEVFDKIGGFDEDLIRNQDDDLNFRLTKEGYKILYNPEIQSEYYVRGSLKKLYKQYYQYGYWKVYVNKKHKTVTSIRQLVPLFFVLGLFLGVFLSILTPIFWYLFLGGICFYSLLACVFAYKSSKKTSEILRIARIFPILHFSYGFGYLIGIIQFLLLGKKPSQKSKEISRS
jgi:cellulose synthase/poly-beta-1,6-N-acetylglucosamine synthase-like glycosyltransferase